MDYSRYPDSNRYYTGAERKKGIQIKKQAYIVKYQKKSPEGLRYNHVSEYIGSHIFEALGMEAQTTFLGTCDGQQVVVMKDFLSEGETFVPFIEVGDSSLEKDKERYQYSYEDIMEMLYDNIKLTDVRGTIDNFWKTYVIDALTGNFDRHGRNWGFIKKQNRYRLAPVFDNGSCLFPSLNTDEKLAKILKSKEEMEQRIYRFPTSQIRLNGKKSSYYEVISSLKFEECNRALEEVVERMNLEELYQIVHDIDQISELRKEFYCTILQQRYEKILLHSYHARKQSI